jgi:protein SCO1/2
VVVTDRCGRDSLPSLTADELEPGAVIPDVKLINQDGKTLHLGDLKGKAVLLTFIYTRCPFANFCPLLSNEFASLRKEMLKTPGDYARTHFVSVFCCYDARRFEKPGECVQSDVFREG